MKNDRNNTSLGLPSGESSSETPRADVAASEIDITKDRLGEILAGRRHQLGLRIEEIAEDIKIRADYLRAIEQEAFDKLPTVEYGRLFLKSYAERLGLNVSDVYALYDVHHRPSWEPPRPRTVAPNGSGMPAGPTPRMPAPKPIPTKVWIYLVVGIIAIAIIILGVLKLLNPKDGESSGMQQPASSEQQVAQSAPAVEPEAVPSTTPVVDTAPTVPATEEVVIDAEMLLTLTFDRDTWVKLIADSDTIASGIFGAGKSVQAKGLDRFTLSLGHTEGVQANVNGRQLRPFSDWTRKFTGMVITADSVASWMLPAQPSGGPIQ
jgi:cytoskeletal protein RodZ